MAEKRVSVRIAASGGKSVRAEFQGIARDGRRSFAMVGQEVDGLNRRLGSLGRRSGAARFAMRNMGMQLNQVAQQGSVTGDYMRAMMIQLPDMLLGFGSLGVAIGIVAGVLGPFVVDLLGASDTSAKLSDSITSLESAVTDYASSVDAARAPTSDLTKKYGDLSGAARELLGVQQDLARQDALVTISDTVDAVRGALSGIVNDVGVGMSKQSAAIDDLKANLEAAQKAYLDFYQSGNGSSDQWTALRLNNDLKQAQQLYDMALRARDGMGRLTAELGTSDEALRQLINDMEALGNANGVDEQAAALERLRTSYIEALGGVENMTAEQRTLLGQLTDASLATIQFRSTMDEASVSVGGAAAQATTLADELSRAAGNAMSLVSQSLSAVNESTIRLQYKDNPTGLAKALAGNRFDARVGDTSGADPIVQEGLRRQREAYVANAEAVARNQQALAAWNREQRKAASGAARTNRTLAEQATGWAAASNTLEVYVERSKDMAAGFGDTIVGAFRSAEQAIGNFVRTGKLDFSSLIRSMLADLAMLAARKYILGPIADGVMGWIDGLGGAASAAVHHSGGIVGGPTQQRVVPAAVFAGAPRMHSGGWAGLRPDEVPAILQRGERVLSRREVAAGNGGVSRLEVSLAPGIEARILDRARGQAVRIVQEGIRSYDRLSLPRRVEQIKTMPGVTG